MSLVSSLTFLTCISFVSCRTDQKEITQGSDPSQNRSVTEATPDLQTSGNDSLGDPIPDLNGELVFAQAFDTFSRRALLTGLPGAVSANVEKVCALNVSSTSILSPTCVTITSADGSFREWLEETNVGDTIKVWGEGSAIGQTASIEEKVQYWFRRFPKATRSFYLEKSAAAPIPGLFIGADDGLYFIHRDDLNKDLAAVYPKRFGTESGLYGDPIVGITSDGNGGLWITQVSALVQLSLSHVTWVNGRVQADRYGTVTGARLDTAHALIGDGSGGVFFGTNSGIGHFKLINGQISYVRYDDPHRRPITAIVADQNGNFWLGSYFAFVYRLKFVSGQPQFTTFTAPADLLYETMTSLAFDVNGDLFVGTTKGLGQILKPNGPAPVFVSHAGSVPHNITDLALDTNGRLIVSTQNAGILRFSPALGAENFVAPTNLPYPFVTRLFYDNDSNKLWAGVTDGTLSKWSAGDVVRIADDTGHAIVTIPNSVTNSLPDNDISAVSPDGENKVWIGTGYGLSYLDYSGQDAQFKNLTTKDGLANDWVTSLAAVGKGEAWVGTFNVNWLGSLSHVMIQQDGQVQIANYPLPSPPVALLATGPDDIWIGTQFLGLYHLTIDSNGANKLECYNDLVGGLPIDPTSLAFDLDGSLWIGSRDSGLYRLSFDANAMPNVERFQIAPNWFNGEDPVTSLAPDGAGGVWVAHIHVAGLMPTTNVGLYHMTFDANRNPHLDRYFNNGIYLSLNNPISSNEIKSLLADGPSSVWVGTNEGIDHLTVTPTGFETELYAAGDPRTALNVLPSGNVTTLVRHPLGGIFAGTPNGLALINP